MAYCTRCGTQNPDQAAFCSNCGNPFRADAKPQRFRRDEECEEACSSGPSGNRVFWGIILALIGLFIIWELGLKNVTGLPQWIYDFQFWWVVPVLIGIAVMVAGLRMILKKT